MSEDFFTVNNLSFQGRGPFSFSLEKGGCIGISGPSGIGKTQLLRALTDLIPSTGRICLNGLDRTDVAAPRWRTMITMLPTDSAWWYEVVEDHFQDAGGPTITADDLECLGLPTRAMQWHVTRLSTGEKQRLAMLRSLQTRPRIVLLDEPSSGLDPHHTGLMESFLRQKRVEEGLSIVWVSHDFAQLERVADSILEMQEDDLRQLG